MKNQSSSPFSLFLIFAFFILIIGLTGWWIVGNYIYTAPWQDLVVFGVSTASLLIGTAMIASRLYINFDTLAKYAGHVIFFMILLVSISEMGTRIELGTAYEWWTPATGNPITTAAVLVTFIVGVIFASYRFRK